MLQIKEHITFILAALVFTAFSLPAQAGVSIRIGTLGYGQAYGYGFSSGTNYYGPSSYYDRSSKHSRHNNHRNNYYNKHSPSTSFNGYYPLDSYKYRYQTRPSYFNDHGNSYARGYDHGYNDGYSDSRRRYKGARVSVKKRK